MYDELTGEIPVPDCCHVCASENIRITDLKDGKRAWACNDCDAFVTCHDGTTTPVGYMAGYRTRTLRKKAHVAFDRLWQDQLMTRDQAYLWLSVVLKIKREEAHISWLTNDQLKQTVKLSRDHFNNSAEVLLKRKAKKRR